MKSSLQNQENTGLAHSDVFTNSEKINKKIEEDKKLKASLESRDPAKGNPNATIADPYMVRVEPRYTIVQNRSTNILSFPDLKTGPEDMGLDIQPGEVVLLTDFYSPQEINRSRGLRWAMEQEGVGGNKALVPLNSEEEGKDFVLPEKKTYPKGSSFEDTSHNDFDDRFAELEEREAKREEKLLRKTLASRRTRQHGQAPSRI